jgi:hypothetical protein
MNLYKYILFSELYGRDVHPNNCPDFLRCKNVFIKPEILDFHKIEYHTVLQKPGQLMVTFMAGLHMVMNLTNNMCEATNLGPPMWLMHGLNSNKCIYKGPDRNERCGERYYNADFLQVMRKHPEVLIQKMMKKAREHYEMVKKFGAMKINLAQMRSIIDDLQQYQANVEVNNILLFIPFSESVIFYLFLLIFFRIGHLLFIPINFFFRISKGW